MANDDTIISSSHAGRQPATDATLYHLERVDNQTLMRLSMLSLPEIDQLKHEIASIFPAGNLPGMILAGLVTLNGRHVSRKRAEEDIGTLIQGAKLLPHGLYSVFFAGPAVVLAVYQKMLALSGKDLSDAYPEGMWQFYLQFALREDTGRHTNETIGYHRDRPGNATLVDDIAAWIMTAIHALFDTDGLTGAIWTEWTTLRLLVEAMVEAGLAETSPYTTLLRNWQHARPYRTPAGVSYADRRRMAFDTFAQKYYEQLPTGVLAALGEKLHKLAEEQREAYQDQMSLLATLKPGRFRDERIPIPLWNAKVGLIWRGHTYLFDVCARDEQCRPIAYGDGGEGWPLVFDRNGNPLDRHGKPLVIQGGWLYRFDKKRGAEPVAYLSPPDAGLIKGMVRQIVEAPRPPSASVVDLRLVSAPRSEQEKLRSLLPRETQEALALLSLTPILVNWDMEDRSLPLGRMRRRARRGVGDHCLTILRTADSIVFDQSHIFFDGTWGMAMAEVLTNQAVSWCHHMVSVLPIEVPPVEPLKLVSSVPFEEKVAAIAEQEFAITAEADAESEAVDLSIVHEARVWLKQRGVSLTVNDLLILARIFHAVEYKPTRGVAQAVAALPDALRKVVVDSLEGSRGINPALLIPMDASFVAPRERIFPITFRNPLSGIFDVYDETLEVLKSYRTQLGNDRVFAVFDERRRELFSYLRAFGEILDSIKAIAMRGESINLATLKMIAHLPLPMQALLNQIPERVGILNEIIKGEEVFSNVGRVAADSSLVRFLSAKDDGRAKLLVWGILTDDQGRMHITLRDFRPHVAPLIQAGHADLANRLAEDYVESYAATLSDLAGHLAEIALAEDEMMWGRPR